jgi:hypothetical protein
MSFVVIAVVSPLTAAAPIGPKKKDAPIPAIVGNKDMKSNISGSPVSGFLVMVRSGNSLAIPSSSRGFT